MNNESVLKVLAEEIKEQRNLYTEEIARGAFDKLEQYREACGVVRGLDIVNSYIADLYNRLYKEDDDVN